MASNDDMSDMCRSDRSTPHWWRKDAVGVVSEGGVCGGVVGGVCVEGGVQRLWQHLERCASTSLMEPCEEPTGSTESETDETTK